jgi:hypothetical protein
VIYGDDPASTDRIDQITQHKINQLQDPAPVRESLRRDLPSEDMVETPDQHDIAPAQGPVQPPPSVAPPSTPPPAASPSTPHSEGETYSPSARKGRSASGSGAGARFGPGGGGWGGWDW